MNNSSPINWDWRSLADVIETDQIALGRGNVISKVDIENHPGDYPIYSSSASATGMFGRYGRYMFDEELITWSVDGGGKPFYRPKHKFSVTNVCGFLKIKDSGRWDYRFVAAIMREQHRTLSFDWLLKAHPSVIRDLYRLPRIPLREQQRIAEILDSLDDQIRVTEKLLVKHQIMRRGLVDNLLSRGVHETGQLRNPITHPELFSSTTFGYYPSSWSIRRLAELVSLPNGQVDPRVAPYSEMTLIAPDHVGSGTGELLQRVSARDQEAISGKYLFQPGDVIYSKIRPYLRKAVLASEVGICSADMYPLRPSDDMNPHFLLAIVLGENFSRFAESVSMRTGIPKLNRREFEEYSLVVPPRLEQDVIVGHFYSIDSQIDTETRLLHKLRLQKSGLMSDLLTGNVRVPLEATP